MQLPNPRGPLSGAIVACLRRPAPAAGDLVGHARHAITAVADHGADVLADDDVQLGLHVLYELHYTGLDGIDPRWEWAPDLLAARAVIECALERRLRGLFAERAPYLPPLPVRDSPRREHVVAALTAVRDGDDGPSLASYLARHGSPEQVREFLVHRSVYQLKEADPHSFAIPRLSGPAKVALVEIQSDEYGGGRPEWQHAAMFARTLRCLGLADQPGGYVDAVPGITLAHVNVMTLFGLHRRWRGAIAGHLAMLEMTSTRPNRGYASTLRRLGFGEQATAYFDEHVEADAVHEQIAARHLCGELVEAEPQLLPDVLLGAIACLALDAAMARHLLDSWSAGRSSLRGEGLGRRVA